MRPPVTNEKTIEITDLDFSESTPVEAAPARDTTLEISNSDVVTAEKPQSVESAEPDPVTTEMPRSVESAALDPVTTEMPHSVESASAPVRSEPSKSQAAS